MNQGSKTSKKNEVIKDEPGRSCFNCWRYQDKNFPCAIPNIDRTVGCSAWEKKEVNMEKKDKPLSEWTLKEVQELCDNQDDCPGCPFYTAENGCMFSGEAASWPLEASEAMTTPSAEESSAPDKPAKPRLAVLWNVEVGEPFTIVHEGREFTDLTLSQEGYVFGDVPVYVIFDAINDPARVHKQVRLTEQELELCRMFEVKYLTRNVNSWCVHMWHTRPSENEGGMGKYYAIDIREASEIGAVDARFFPSIEPGDCICVEETVE